MASAEAEAPPDPRTVSFGIEKLGGGLVGEAHPTADIELRSCLSQQKLHLNLHAAILKNG